MGHRETPVVSVIVPNYNHAPYLRHRIDSILTQTYQDFELILLDDCSTDSSREILESYANEPRVRTEFNAQNSGSSFKQWNKGVRMARGRYIWIAESDDYAEPHFAARMVAILEERADVMFAWCHSWSIGEADERLGLSAPYLTVLDDTHWTKDFIVDGNEECRRFFVLANPVPNASAAVFRKDCYERVGTDSAYRVCADYKMWASMALEGKIAYVAEPLNNYRTHRENVRTRSQLGALDIAEFFYAMLTVLRLVAPGETLLPYTHLDETLRRMPHDLNPGERIQASKRLLTYVTDWNLRYNDYVPRTAIHEHFKEWEFALEGRAFGISAPSRWRFFIHRCRFYRHYFPQMNWKQRILNLMRLIGAPIIGYRHRHWPEEACEKVLRTLYVR